MTGDPTTVQKLVQEHFQKTNSDLAAKLLADWESHSACFWKIVPQPPAALADSSGVTLTESIKPPVASAA